MAVAKKGFEFFLNRLLKGFRSVEKREPNNLEMILIRQEAGKKAVDANKVIEVNFGKPFNEEIEAMIKSGDVNVGTAPKTPPYQKSQADIEFEIMEKIKADNEKAIKAFESRNPNKPRDEKYTGGMVDVEPSLSDIGHGSDALMARTRLVSPGSQSTTSTGLNYLLAEDNDNIRVPFEDGLKVYPKIMASKSNEDLGDGKNVDLQDLTYGGTLMYDKGPLSAGIEYLKGKDKFDFKNKDDTLFKDTTDRELANLILMMKLKNGLIKFKGNKDNQMINFSKSFADGGRIGFSKGKGVDLLRRGFLKTMGAAGAGIAALKTGLLGLGGKQATKEVAKELITTPAAAGKPPWFDALVTRVIREGDDVTKTMATKDRQNVYRKKIDDETEVVVTQDLDEGVTRIDIDDSTRNVTGFDDPPTVSLQVTDEIVEEGGARIKPEFKATENDYRNYATDPDGGYETELIENTVENTKDLTSDLTKVKSFATKKGPTMKEIVGSKKRKDNVKYAQENPSSYAADRGPDYDPSDYIEDMADDFASGGIARMLGE